MSLEQALEQNTAAVVALHADIKKLIAAGGLPAGEKAAAPASEPATETKRGPGRPKKDEAPAAPKVSFDEMKAALLKVKDTKSKDAAQAIIKNVGKAEKMDGIKPEHFAAVLAAAEAALTDDDAGSGDDDGL